MNVERIQELYKQAIQYTNSVIPAERRYNDIYYATACGKHAELIVKECVQMFAENGYDESCDMLIEHWDIDPRTFRS